jgi:hypothetical protein
VAVKAVANMKCLSLIGGMAAILVQRSQRVKRAMAGVKLKSREMMMLNTIMTFLGYAVLLLWAVSWTNFLHPVYNWWGVIVWAGETFK